MWTGRIPEIDRDYAILPASSVNSELLLENILFTLFLTELVFVDGPCAPLLTRYVNLMSFVNLLKSWFLHI